jgi:hypothetical protein
MSMTVREHLQLHAALKGLAQPQSLALETVLQAMRLSGTQFIHTGYIITSPSHYRQVISMFVVCGTGANKNVDRFPRRSAA